MRAAKHSYLYCAVFGLLACGGQRAAVGDPYAAQQLAVPRSPDEEFGELFERVQIARVFPDQKTFVDALPKLPPAQIMQDFAALQHDPQLDLHAFVLEHFTLPRLGEATPPAGLALVEHIEWLWPRLTRAAEHSVPGHSLLELPKPYVVPGGRYQELYYWDSYFTMLGLARSGQRSSVRAMVDDFAYELDRFGHAPNGSRSYYLSRSQPPFFACMVDLLAELEGDAVYASYLPQLRREHAYWMAGADALAPGSAARRVVRLPDGSLLNRYWDDRDTPRPEAYAYDVETASLAQDRPANEVYRELRAAAESGWDFSSRWLADGTHLHTIQTTAILPIDLNSLLFHLEQTIARGCQAAQDAGCVTRFGQLAQQRSAAIQAHLWSEAGFYTDYDWLHARASNALTAALASALFAGVATPERAQLTAAALRQLLAPGGLLTTARTSEQQWEAPNGWAPLVWIAVAGLRRYQQQDLAREIGSRFLARIQALYALEGKLVEKYDVQSEAVLGGGGGEYPMQDGFGWTNGVALKLLELYGPQPAAAQR